MGYSHGKKWTGKEIENGILDVMLKNKIDCMPTHTMIKNTLGDYSLVCAISKHGGTKYWANRLGLDVKKCESKFGEDYEYHCKDFLIEKLDMECEKTKARYPYDLLVDKNIKVDVKVSKPYKDSYYTFNLEKTEPTCDLFVLYCVTNENSIYKTFVIPSCVLSKKTQVSLGMNTSKYNKYINAWDLFYVYKDFYEQLSNY